MAFRAVFPDACLPGAKGINFRQLAIDVLNPVCRLLNNSSGYNERIIIGATGH